MNDKAVVPREPEVMPTVIEPVSILAVIDRAARDPNVDVDKMERLLALHERFTARQAETAFNSALNEAQGKIRAVVANAENKHTDSRYADYPKLDSILRPIYIEQGFSLSFDTEDAKTPEAIRVLCRVSHRDGHTRVYHVDMPADGKGAKGGDVMTKTHATGSAVSYGMRYLLKMIFNVAVTEDDDGNAAGAVCITDKEAADLRALATELGANIPAFLQVMKAETFEKIPASRYKDALATLQAKRNRGTP